MATNPNPDRDQDYMYEMWGTKKLVTDYSCNFTKKIIKTEHNFTEQSNLHQKIRNDDDYDDWEYGTEPIHSSRWK